MYYALLVLIIGYDGFSQSTTPIESYELCLVAKLRIESRTKAVLVGNARTTVVECVRVKQ